MSSAEWERGYAAGYHAAHRTDVRDITTDRGKVVTEKGSRSVAQPKRKVSPYQKRYGKEFKKLEKKYKKKNGSWVKDGFKRCQKAAHTATRKAMK